MSSVLITGCSSGYGKATAQVFLNERWNVVATMRRPQNDLFEGPGERLRVLPLDVTDDESIRRALDEAIAAFGGIDVLVNNAGIGQFSPLETTSRQTVKSVFETNTFGVIAMIQAIIPHMRERGSGTIINVTSAVTFGPKPLNSVYGASKFAVDGLSEALYFELAPFGIRVKMVEPGYGPQTAFTANTLAAADDNAFTPPYQAHLDAMRGRLKGGSNSTTDDDVARAVLRCAIEASDQLRTPAGPDAIASAERRRSMSEQAFLEKQRGLIGLPKSV
jgi:NAD(P)-dependent dehydrogenase (short-subunit alcohol dehydrogenase family)